MLACWVGVWALMLTFGLVTFTWHDLLVDLNGKWGNNRVIGLKDAGKH